MCPECRSDKYTLHRCAVGVRYVGQCSACGYTAYETVSVLYGDSADEQERDRQGKA